MLQAMAARNAAQVQPAGASDSTAQANAVPASHCDAPLPHAPGSGPPSAASAAWEAATALYDALRLTIDDPELDDVVHECLLDQLKREWKRRGIHPELIRELERRYLDARSRLPVVEYKPAMLDGDGGVMPKEVERFEAGEGNSILRLAYIWHQGLQRNVEVVCKPIGATITVTNKVDGVGNEVVVAPVVTMHSVGNVSKNLRQAIHEPLFMALGAAPNVHMPMGLMAFRMKYDLQQDMQSQAREETIVYEVHMAMSRAAWSMSQLLGGKGGPDSRYRLVIVPEAEQAAATSGSSGSGQLFRGHLQEPNQTSQLWIQLVRQKWPGSPHLLYTQLEYHRLRALLAQGVELTGHSEEEVQVRVASLLAWMDLLDTKDLAVTLRALHGLGHCHHDVKPGNLVADTFSEDMIDRMTWVKKREKLKVAPNTAERLKFRAIDFGNMTWREERNAETVCERGTWVYAPPNLAGNIQRAVGRIAPTDPLYAAKEHQQRAVIDTFACGVVSMNMIMGQGFNTVPPFVRKGAKQPRMDLSNQADCDALHASLLNYSQVPGPGPGTAQKIKVLSSLRSLPLQLLCRMTNYEYQLGPLRAGQGAASDAVPGAAGPEATLAAPSIQQGFALAGASQAVPSQQQAANGRLPVMPAMPEVVAGLTEALQELGGQCKLPSQVLEWIDE